MADVGSVSVQKIVGHLNIETTLRYAHLSPGHLWHAVN
jgi:site-specific recombinase XerD